MNGISKRSLTDGLPLPAHIAMRRTTGETPAGSAGTNYVLDKQGMGVYSGDMLIKLRIYFNDRKAVFSLDEPVRPGRGRNPFSSVHAKSGFCVFEVQYG